MLQEEVPFRPELETGLGSKAYIGAWLSWRTAVWSGTVEVCREDSERGRESMTMDQQRIGALCSKDAPIIGGGR